MSGATPGPWSISSDVPTSSGLAIADLRGRVIAIAKNVPQADMIASACEANAALIAAAPDLLAAIRPFAIGQPRDITEADLIACERAYRKAIDSAIARATASVGGA